MHQIMLLWHAYLKVYHSLKVTDTKVLIYWEDFKNYILAVNVDCGDLILLLSCLLRRVLAHHVVDNPSLKQLQETFIRVILNFPQRFSILLDPGWLQVDLCCAALVLLEGVRGACVFCPVTCSEFCSKWKCVGILPSSHTWVCVGVNGYGRSRVVGN